MKASSRTQEIDDAPKFFAAILAGVRGVGQRVSAWAPVEGWYEVQTERGRAVVVPESPQHVGTLDVLTAYYKPQRLRVGDFAVATHPKLGGIFYVYRLMLQ